MTLAQARRTLRKHIAGTLSANDTKQLDKAIAKVVDSWSSQAKGGKASRLKGQRGERELGAILETYWPAAARGFQARSGGDAPDVDGTPYWWEAKRLKRHGCLRHFGQAASATDGRPPIVALREDGNTDWFVLLKLSDFLPLATRPRPLELGYQSPDDYGARLGGRTAFLQVWD